MHVCVKLRTDRVHILVYVGACILVSPPVCLSDCMCACVCVPCITILSCYDQQLIIVRPPASSVHKLDVPFDHLTAVHYLKSPLPPSLRIPLQNSAGKSVR